MKFKTLLFDFDGTLVDSMPTFSRAMLKILNENAITYDDDIIKVLTPLGYGGVAKFLIDNGVAEDAETLVERMLGYAIYEYEHTITAKKNVVDTLKKLKADGVSLNILTASPHPILDGCLRRLEIFDLFDNVWSCDDFSTSKQDPEIYLRAAEKLGVGVDSVLFLDDNYIANKTAKSAGMKSCGVYDSSSDAYIEDIKSVADFYIYDFSELLKL